MTVSTQDVANFYNDFSKSVLLKSFQTYNPRQAAVKQLCDQFIAPNARILEVGCGAGNITHHLAQQAALIVGVDITEVGLKIASTFVDLPHSHFYLADLTQGVPDTVSQHGPFDVIVMADVVEHIPLATRPQLLQHLAGLLDAGGRLIMTYPTPAYQQHLRQHDPDKLQVIDEDVHLGDLLHESGLLPYHFQTMPIWHDNMYNHAVLTNDISYRELPTPISQKVINTIRNLSVRLRYLSFVRKLKHVL